MSIRNCARLLDRPGLYVISGDQAPERQADILCMAIDGGAVLVQLRNKSAPPGDLLAAAVRVRAHAHAHGALLVVNDHLDLAIAAGADGVHLGQDDLAVAQARDRWSGLVGQSTHSVAQAIIAQEAGVDYIGVGPVYETPTKPGRAAVGLGLLAEVKASVSLPWFAIGGIDGANIDQVIAAGASRVAVVRAVCDAPDPAAAARGLLDQLAAPAAVTR
ncbi:MAG TPA: thiamine phosphate synthase [Candidatus Solibacter sp.]|jgi:thiamine-phosphate pyrophosphorylase|nr:thiamine phosphate synthase [Candidatus Solibacter sp.]